MDALHPRLLVADFTACFDFYDAVLPPLCGAHLVKGTADGPYANWDVADEGVLVLFDRAAMAAVLGAEPATDPAAPAAPSAPTDAVMFVCRVDDVDAAYALCLAHGATAVLPPIDRPAWGPNLRTAHVRDPDGTLIELQSY
ncbi:VOC family protein [Kitasatospora sp. NPDC049285]|uniref:VOC family protein n=1 Tax=Kitasatospora sp. NPDC049285 TaxID=3157096 RepID=UPI0034323804